MAIVRKRKSPASAGKKYFILVFVVFSVLLVHKNMAGSKIETIDGKADELKEVSPHGEIVEEINKIVINDFEEKFEEEEKEREHLDTTLENAKLSIDILEEDIVEEMETELYELLNFKDDDIREKVQTYLLKRNGEVDDSVLETLVERIESRVDEEVRVELRTEAEEITIEVEEVLEEIVLEDVLTGKENTEIENDLQVEKEILEEDLVEELEDALMDLMDTVVEKIEEIEEEVLDEYNDEAPQPEIEIENTEQTEVTENPPMIENEDQTEEIENEEKGDDMEDAE